MQSYKSFVVLIVAFVTITCCSGRDITAYVKEALTTTTCESVTKIPSVCNINWKVPHSARANYREYIKAINESISSSSIVFGLRSFEAAKCRKAYETMLCRSYFPICDAKKMVINYGNGTSRCELVAKWCSTTSITCKYSTNGELPIVEEKDKCVPLPTNTSKICRDFRVKVPKGYMLFADNLIKTLSATAENFERQVKNRTDMETCLGNYKEVLCRLIGGCSEDGYYSLYLISRQECEEKVSCVKNFPDLENVQLSMCDTLPSADGLKNVTVKNVIIDEPLASSKVYQAFSKATISPEITKQISNSKPSIKITVSSKVEEEISTPKTITKATIFPVVKNETDNPEAANNNTISPESNEETRKPTSSSNKQKTTDEYSEKDEKEKRIKLSKTTSDGLSQAKNGTTKVNLIRSGDRSAGNVNQYLAWFYLVLSTFSLLVQYGE